MKSKPRLLGLTLLVFLQQTRLGHPDDTFVKEELESIVVERRQGSPYDYFTVNMKVNHTCSYSSCIAHQAIHRGNVNGPTSCGCVCWSPLYFFRTSELRCTNLSQAKNFGGCENYFNAETQPNHPVDLNVKKRSKTFTVDITVESCSLSGQYYYDYSGFQSTWKSVNFFTSKLTGGQSKLKIEWSNPDTNNALSGRMIRLNVSCTVSSPASSFTHCILFKAVGNVAYSGPLSSATSTKYQDVSTTPVGSQRNLSLSTSSTPLPSLPLSPTSLEELSTSSLPRLSSSSIQYIRPPPSSSSSVMATSPLTLSPSVGLFSRTSKSLRMTQSISSLVPSSQIKTTKLPEVTSRQMQTTLSSKDLPKKSDDSADKEVSTANLPHSSSRVRAVPPARPSKPTTPKSSRSTGGVVPADKGGRTGGNDNGTVIGAAVGGALVLGIVVIIAVIVFWKRRKALDTKGKQAKPGKTHNHVTNPAYETSNNDIQLEVSKGMKTKSSPAQDDQYQGLIIENGQSNGAAIYSSADSNYDNCAVYQSLDKQTPSSPVYQALDERLLEGTPTTGIPNSKHTTLTDPQLKPSDAGIPAAGQPKRGSSAAQDPVYNVLDGPGAGQETMTEPLYNVLEGQDYDAVTVNPLYSVPEGPDSEEGTPGGGPGTTEEAVYNVLEGPNATHSPTNERGPSENDAIYNVLESPDAEKSPLVGNGPSNEPLYNVLEEQDGHGSNQGLPKESLHSGAHDNPSYEQTLEFNEPYADVHRPETQKESVYEPLRRPREDLYEPLA